MTDTALEPWTVRLVEACTTMLASLDDDERSQLLALRDLDPDGFRGISIRNLDDDFIEVSWIGRRLGAIRRAWLFEDES